MNDFESSEEFKAHKRIGFPKISKEDQSKALIYNDDTIRKLAPSYKNGPFFRQLIKYYVTITYKELKEYIESTNHVEYQLLLSKKRRHSDGRFLKEENGMYLIYDYERGQIQELDKLGNFDEAIDYYASQYFKRLS
jgi:phenolic acid decarboxylase